MVWACRRLLKIDLELDPQQRLARPAAKGGDCCQHLSLPLKLSFLEGYFARLAVTFIHPDSFVGGRQRVTLLRLLTTFYPSNALALLFLGPIIR